MKAMNAKKKTTSAHPEDGRAEEAPNYTQPRAAVKTNNVSCSLGKDEARHGPMRALGSASLQQG